MGRRGWVLSSLVTGICASAVALTACGGRSQGNDAGDDDETAAGRSGAPHGISGARSGAGAEQTSGGGDAGEGGNSAETGAGTGGAGGSPVDCGSPHVPSSTLRRLGRFEFNNTVRDVLGDDSHPADAFLGDSFPSGSGTVETVSAELASHYHDYAHAFALGATSDAARLKSIVGCDVAAEGEAACRGHFNAYVIAAVFRQPVTAEAVAELDAVFATGRDLGGDFASGIRAVLEVALQSPEFLYRVEFGEPLEDGPVATDPTLGRPSSHEMASRLSYLLLGSSPDNELRSAADEGALQTREQIEAQARRLLRSPRARDVLFQFHARLLHFQQRDSLVAKMTPGGLADIVDLSLEETSRFIGEVAWSGSGSFERLWTAPFSWISGRLGVLYGAEVSGPEFQRVQLNPAQRGGLLTQVSFLASSTSAERSNPVWRGRLVAERLFCSTLPPPPAHIELMPSAELDPNATTRQLYEKAINVAESCTECHRNMDPLGYAFEHYDGFGRWRDTEQGQPVDATGELFETDAAGTFDGALELSARIAQSQDAKNCYAGMWMTYAYGREEAPEDACSRRTLEEAFARSGGDIVELVAALTQTDGFLYRRIDEIRQ